MVLNLYNVYEAYFKEKYSMSRLIKHKANGNLNKSPLYRLAKEGQTLICALSLETKKFVSISHMTPTRIDGSRLRSCLTPFPVSTMYREQPLAMSSVNYMPRAVVKSFAISPKALRAALRKPQHRLAEQRPDICAPVDPSFFISKDAEKLAPLVRSQRRLNAVALSHAQRKLALHFENNRSVHPLPITQQGEDAQFDDYLYNRSSLLSIEPKELKLIERYLKTNLGHFAKFKSQNTRAVPYKDTTDVHKKRRAINNYIRYASPNVKAACSSFYEETFMHHNCVVLVDITKYVKRGQGLKDIKVCGSDVLPLLSNYSAMHTYAQLQYLEQQVFEHREEATARLQYMYELKSDDKDAPVPSLCMPELYELLRVAASPTSALSGYDLNHWPTMKAFEQDFKHKAAKCGPAYITKRVSEQGRVNGQLQSYQRYYAYAKKLGIMKPHTLAHFTHGGVTVDEYKRAVK